MDMRVLALSLQAKTKEEVHENKSVYVHVCNSCMNFEGKICVMKSDLQISKVLKLHCNKYLSESGRMHSWRSRFLSRFWGKKKRAQNLQVQDGSELTIEFLQIKLFRSDPISEDEGVRTAKVGHSARVQLSTWK